VLRGQTHGTRRKKEKEAWFPEGGERLQKQSKGESRWGENVDATSGKKEKKKVQKKKISQMKGVKKMGEDDELGRSKNRKVGRRGKAN